MGAALITQANEARHRAQFRAWTALLGLQLKRRGARLVVDAPYGARMAGFPHIDVDYWSPEDTTPAEGSATLTLRVGRGVHIGPDTHFDVWSAGTNRLDLADGVVVNHGVRLQLRNGAIEIGEHTHLRDSVVLKSEGLLTIGRDCTISYGNTYHCQERIEIGDLAGIAEHVTIIDSDHTHDGSDHNFLEQALRPDPVRIGRNVMIGANAVVLRGTQIGNNTVVGAGSVVVGGQFEDGWLVAGAPARPVRELASTTASPGPA